MRRTYSHILTIIYMAVLPQLITGNTSGKDFLITLNGYKLTGQIKDISLSKNDSQISFVNDFGDTYVIYPATIYGFAFMEKGETSLYESKFLDGIWQFLKVEKRGKELTLYKSVERQLKFTGSGEAPIVEKERNAQIWLQFAKEQPIKVHRFNYKGILKRRMASSPELIERLGKRGFRYQDLEAIVELYNELQEKQKDRTDDASI